MAAAQTLPEYDDASAPPRRSWWRWLFGTLVLMALIVAATVPLGLWWLGETPRGRAFVAQQISGVEPANGIRFEVGSIDGSLLSRFDMVDIVVKDLDGTLALIPLARVDWEPITLFGNLVSLNRLEVPEVRMLRMWKLYPRDPNEPLLPDIDLRIGRFEFPRIILEKPVLGRAETMSANGRAEVRAGRALVDMQVRAARGDRLLLFLDAEPDRDRFDLKADLRAPAGGLVTMAAGLARPLAVTATGTGTWSRWRGRLDADLGAADAEIRVAALTIQADDGRFRLTGDTRPDALMEGLGLKGPAAALLGGIVNIDATANRDGEWMNLRLGATSPILALTSEGRVDTTDNILDGVRVEAVLKQPQQLNPALSGSGLRAKLAADGPLDDPNVRWTATADTLRWAGESGPIGADGLAAEGQVRLAAEDRPLAIPFSASARKAVGLPPELLALLQQPRLSGTLTFADETLDARGLNLRTTRMTATGSARLLPNGRATGAIDANLPRFEVDGLGAVAVRAVARIDRAPGSAVVVDGRFEGRALTLANAGARDFLGGLPTAGGSFTLAANGRLALRNGVLQSPNLGVSRATGSYDPASGRFTLDAAGRSRAYGPFTVVASGTSTAPTGTVRLASPGFGLGLTDVVADITPAPGGVLLVARGDSPQGLLSGRVLVGFGQGRPLSLDISSANFAGIEARGRLVQTAAGPFAGTLVIDGRGVDARLGFSAVGSVQRIDADARALNARLPLETPVAIARGNASFVVVLRPDRPDIRGSFRMSGVRRGTLVLNEVLGAANLQGTSGIATVSARGRAGDGRVFAANARVQSIRDGYALGLDGTVGKLPLKLERPARLVRVAGGWRLLPARLILPQGQVDMAGEWGATRELRLALRDVDLGILDVVSDGWGFGGRANGQVVVRALPQSRIPSGEANLTIAGLQRAGVTGLSVPVDVRVAATSDGSGLVLGARLSWQKNDLGSLVLRVDPGPGGTPTERFMAGRLSGGVRYNGPVEPLWALGGLEGQELKGAVAIGADFSGTPAVPGLQGIARGMGLVYRNAAFGTEIADLAFDGQFSGSELRVNSLTGRANGGTLSGSGVVRLGLDRAVDLALDLKSARLANSDTLQFTVSGPLRLAGRGNEATLTGDLRVDSARVQLVQVENSEVPLLQVRRAGEIRLPPPEPGLSVSSIRLDVRVRADDRVRVEGMGLDSIWQGDVQIRGTATSPQLVGTATLERGEFTFAGSDFDLTSGRVSFSGKPLESAINIQARTQAQDVTAFVTISGTAARPDIRFSSSPTLPEDEILARLLFGSSVADLSVTEAVQLATAVAGLQSGVDTMGKIRRSVGVDRLRLVGDNSATGMGTGIAIGKRLSRNIYVEVLTDSQGNTLTSLQLTLSRIWSLFIEVSSVGQSSANVRYQREY